MNIIKGLFHTKHLRQGTSGVLERPGYSPDKHNFERKELVSAHTPIQWREKRPIDFTHYWNGQYNQDGSGSCYAWSLSLLAERQNEQEENKRIKFSARQVYALAGEPYPTRGMYVEKGMRWLKDNGMTLEHLLPSNNRSEIDMRKLDDYTEGDHQVGMVYKPSGFAYLTSYSFDEIAEVLEEGRFLSVSVVGTNEGWTNKNGWARPPRAGETPWYHAITLTDYGLVNGVKTISFEHAWGDHWGYNNLGYGFLQENYKPYMFVKPQYLLDLPNDWRDTETHITPKPKHRWDVDLWRGITGLGIKEDVIALQDALKYEGCFPYQQKSTGWFAGLTYGAVIKFQEKYRKDILTPLGLSKGTGYVGPATRKQLNKIFS